MLFWWVTARLAQPLTLRLMVLLLLLLCSQLYLWGSPYFWGVRFLCMWPFCDPTVEVVTFRLHGWCMLMCFFAGIHLSRTWMSRSFESMWWKACVHILNLGLQSHPKEFWGMESEPMWTPREKSPLPETQRRVNLATLHHTGQQIKHNTGRALPVLKSNGTTWWASSSEMRLLNLSSNRSGHIIRSRHPVQKKKKKLKRLIVLSRKT